jgi:hypothetical protein
MKRLKISDIMKLNPCYPPTTFLPKNWTGTVKDLLGIDEVPARDRLWVVMRSEFLSDRVLQEFGVACARMVEHLGEDVRVTDCNLIAESYLDGWATLEQVREARTAAYAAAAAAYAAAYAADAADAAAYAAAAYAAICAAAAAADAVYAAVVAYRAAAVADSYAADAAAKREIQEAQCGVLLHVLEYLGE